MQAAAKAGYKVLIAGQVFPYPAHQEYFRREIEPSLRKGLVSFIGPIGLERKLAGGCCLVVPSLAPEISSLAAMEVLAR